MIVPPNALIIVHDGFTDTEFAYAYDRCREEDMTVLVATITGKDAFGEKGIKAKADMGTEFALQMTKYGPRQLWEVLILPGGVKSIEKVRQDFSTIELVKNHEASGKIIAAICHGSQILIEADLCRGRNLSGYYSIKKDIENAGGIYHRGVTVDGNLITAPHYDLNGKWMKAVIKKWASLPIPAAS